MRGKKSRISRRERTRKVNVGKVHSVVKTGHIIVKVKSKLRRPQGLLGAKVFMKSKRENIGFVADVIGNVKEPYIVIKPVAREVLENIAIGEEVYVVITKKETGGRSRGRRKELKRRGRVERKGSKSR